MIRLLLLVFIVASYGWASQVDCGPTAMESLLRHSEVKHAGNLQWITNSDVCTLGKAVWVAWCVALTVHLMVPDPHVARVLLALLGVTVLLTGIMNAPLLFRSLPAYFAIFLFLVWAEGVRP